MEIQVTFRPPRRPGETIQLPDGADVNDALAAVAERPEVVLVLRGGQIIVESTPLVDGDVLEILSAASGG